MKKIVLITGSSNGIGFATATKLVKSGYIVYAGVRQLSSKDALLKAVDFDPSLCVLQLDVTKQDEISNALKVIEERHGRLDVLINNAGAVLLGPPDSATSEEIEWVFKVNVFGVLNLTQKAIPLMRKQKSGHIITIGSIAGVESSAYLGIYAASKFALEGIVASWATTLHKWNIQCSILDPGPINTNLVNSVKVGSYYKKNNPYEKFNLEALNLLKNVLGQGSPPQIVADQIFNIINNPKPNLRYTTCEISKSIIERNLRDAEGNQWVNEHRQFIENWF